VARSNLEKEDLMATHVYVGNLGATTTEETLRTAFAAAGGVKSVVVMRNPKTGRSRGFGFVELSSDSEAAAAIQTMNGVLVEGQPIKVNEARERVAPRPFGRSTPGEGYLGNRSHGGKRKTGSGGGRKRR
jgi:RNA recognition motif-containing protein